MAGMKPLGKAGSGIGLLIVAVICLNIIASKLHIRFDATAEDVYTLSSGSIKIIEDMKKDVAMKLYFSRSNKELPIQIKTYANRVEELLREYASRSSGKITFEIIDPKPDTDDEEWARKYGVQGMRLPSGSDLFFGVVMLQGTHEVAIPYIDPRREEFLEYDVSEALLRSQKPKKPKVGVLSSIPVMEDVNLSQYGQSGSNEWAFVTELRKNFDVSEIKPESAEISTDLDVLIVYHPKNLGEGALFAIDQFVLSGGRVIACVDPMSRVEQMIIQRSGQQPQQGQRPDTSSNLSKLFSSWGIAFNPGEMVGDQQNSMMINAGGRNMNYPFYISFQNEGLSADSVVTSSLKSFLFTEGGYVDVVKGSGIKMESLITASATSGLVKPMFGTFANPMMLVQNFKEDKETRTLAGLFSGKFKTAFPQGGPGENKGESLKESQTESSVLVVADSDFIFDNNAVDKVRFLNQVMLRPKNGNLAFFINAVDFLGGSNELISIRSKGRVSRPFTVVLDIQRQAQSKWKKVEEDLSKQITELQAKLGELQKQRSQGSTLNLSAQQQAEIIKFREEERQVRKKRREVRKNLREDIESLGVRLTAMNMLAVPFILSLFGVFSFAGRSRRNRRRN